MNIEKRTEIIVKTTDGKLVKANVIYSFMTSKGCFIGFYKGTTRQGALKFTDVFTGKTEFNVMPRSITKLHEISDFAVEYAEEI